MERGSHRHRRTSAWKGLRVNWATQPEPFRTWCDRCTIDADVKARIIKPPPKAARARFDLQDACIAAVVDDADNCNNDYKENDDDSLKGDQQTAFIGLVYYYLE